MDFNVKKLASDAGVFFTRAVQVNRLAVFGLMNRYCIKRWQQLWARLLSTSTRCCRAFHPWNV